MAVSDQEVAAWLAANPTASNAEIAQAAAAAGVDANQFERVTGVPAPFEITYGGEMNTPIAYSTKQNIGNDIVDIQYGPSGQQLSATGMPTTINGQRVVTDYSPSGQASYRLYNEPGMFNELLNAAAYLGKGYGLVTGLDALLGSLPSLGSSAASSAADADIAGGMIPEYGTNQAYDAFMSQAMTPEAIAALEKQIAESSVGGLNSQLTMAQIEAGLGTPGYGYGAQAAASGLFDPSLIGAGAYTQTSFPYDMADFLAADVQNLYSQVGSNIPAIEQNLIASGVDPLVAADVANTVVLNPAISTYDLTNYINNTFDGGNVYDVNMATQYPTSVLPDAGGLLSDIPNTSVVPEPVTPTTPTPPADVVTPGTKVVDPDLAKIVTSGLTKVLPGLLTLGGVKALTNKPSTGGIPTQQAPTNSPEYYQAIQQYYNTYMPEVPRDVATPLQQWYDSKYGA